MQIRNNMIFYVSDHAVKASLNYALFLIKWAGTKKERTVNY